MRIIEAKQHTKKLWYRFELLSVEIQIKKRNKNSIYPDPVRTFSTIKSLVILL